MAQTYKVLGQAAPTAASLTPLYTVPPATSVVSSTIMVCNQSATPTTFRLSVAVAGAVDAAKQYVFYDVPMAANEARGFTIGLTLAATDVVRCYATPATLSFNLFGSEIT